MALTLYLAMTAAEIQNCARPPAHMAWMACHFSPYSSGISNVPELLPEGSVLILNDRIPPQGHDPDLVARQLTEAAQHLSVSRVLLDFQRPNCQETAAIAQAVAASLSCPAGITPAYAEGLACPVFLTPMLRHPLQELLKQWPGREIWLEAAIDCEGITVTEQGSHVFPAHAPDLASNCHTDEQLHCRYCLKLEDTCACFTVWRSEAELQTLLAEAENLGIECAIGLYQQLQNITDPPA